MSETSTPKFCGTCRATLGSVYVTERGRTFCGWDCAERMFPSRRCRSTHHTGCDCHEARRDAEVADLRARLARAEEELARHRADTEAAAGELLVPMPESGTDAARMLIANRLLKRRAERAESAGAAREAQLCEALRRLLSFTNRDQHAFCDEGECGLCRAEALLRERSNTEARCLREKP
jgi:hypothetical protein